MSTITFEVDEKNLSFVKTLLGNLKGVKNVAVQRGTNLYATDSINSVRESREENKQTENITVAPKALWK